MDLQTEILTQLAPVPEKPIHIIFDRHGAVTMIQNIAKKVDFELFHLDGTGIKDRGTLFEALAHTMKFPGYFGRNWDALEECLRDLEWLLAKGYIILFEEPQHLLQSSNDDFITFLRIIISAAQEWSKKQVAFCLVLTGDRMLLDLQKCAGIKRHIQVHS